jgi:hypothetical protein
MVLMVKLVDSVHVMVYDTRLCLRCCSCATETQVAILSHLDLVILSGTWFLTLRHTYHYWYANQPALVCSPNRIATYKKGLKFKKYNKLHIYIC